MKEIPVKVWNEVISKAKSNYPISDQYIADDFGQTGENGVHTRKNEKEHISDLLKTKNQNGCYSCYRLRCVELLLYLLEVWKVDSKKIEEFAEIGNENRGKNNLIKPGIETGIYFASLVQVEIYKKYKESFI